MGRKKYHLTDRLCSLIPENQYTELGIVENTTSRISVAPTLFQCLLSPIMNDIKNKTQQSSGYRSYPNFDVAKLCETKYFNDYQMRCFIFVYQFNIP